MSTEPDSAISHIHELDGLRGLAILLVLTFHIYGFQNVAQYLNNAHPSLAALWKVVGFGWCGVDLFFVLSGFLITTILLNTKGSKHYFRAFYGRRVLRIFPLYFLVVLLFFHVQGPLKILPGYGPVEGEEPWFLAYLANWKMGIWALGPLSHFWSLCVEEQFYLVWPLVVWLSGKRTFPWICGGAIFLSLGAGVTFELIPMPHDFVFMATVPRANAILLGALLAWMVRQSWSERIKSQIRVALPALFGAVLILILWPTYFRPMYTIQFLVAGLTWSAILLHCISLENGLIQRAMRSGFLRSFGKFSYAIYVFHQLVFVLSAAVVAPIIQALRLQSDVGLAAVMFSMFGASYVAGVMSWHLFEKHFLRLKTYFKYGTDFSAPAVSEPYAAAPAD